MEFGKKRRKKLPFEEQYPTRFQLYTLPPDRSISLEEFQSLAKNRQKLLQEISNLKEKLVRGDLEEDVFEVEMKKVVNAYFPLKNTGDSNELTMKDIENRRKDHIAHYILRLAYCRTEELRRWYLAQEVALLRFRLQSMAKQADCSDILKRYQELLPVETVPYPDDGPIAEECAFYKQGSHSHLYKVKFTEMLELVQKRKVVVKQGFVYFPDPDMLVSLVCSKFRSLLSQDLVRTIGHLNIVDNDERISGLLKHLKETYTGADFNVSGSGCEGSIKLEQLDVLSKESFPPCMLHLHESLRKEHHLRHFGRLQYGLFLKSIGMSLDQSLAFWRDEFTRKMDADKFDKQYAYNIRHSYGKEGKRTNYTPYNCMKIIMSNGPGTGDHHGCPFRHWDDSHLQEFLTAHGVSMKASHQIIDYKTNTHYQLSCQKYFETVHGLQRSSFSLDHPTLYFIESRNIREGNKINTARDVKSEVKMEDSNNEMGSLSAEQLAEFEDMDEM